MNLILNVQEYNFFAEKFMHAFIYIDWWIIDENLKLISAFLICLEIYV